MSSGLFLLDNIPTTILERESLVSVFVLKKMFCFPPKNKSDRFFY